VENLTGNNAPALPQYHHNIPVQDGRVRRLAATTRSGGSR
jgi:hypothetical protein